MRVQLRNDPPGPGTIGFRGAWNKRFLEQDSELLRGTHVGKIVHIRSRNSSLKFNAVVNLHFQSKQQSTIMSAVRLFYYGD
jgi:hypothetical protein